MTGTKEKPHALTFDWLRPRPGAVTTHETHTQVPTGQGDMSTQFAGGQICRGFTPR